MKFLVLFFVTIALANVFADSISDEEEQAWREFKLEHGKMFLSKNKEGTRKKTFLQNRAKVIELKAASDSGKLKYTPKLYSFADLSDDEFISRYGGFNNEESSKPVKRTFYPTPRQGLPTSFDSRQKGWIGPVKNQGTCGSCWTFSSMSCIEAGLAVKGYSGYDLSEQLLVDCGKSGEDGCQGGRMEYAFAYLAENGGAMQEYQYPYTGAFGRCQYPEVSNGIQVTGPVYPTADKNSVKAALMTHGSLAIAVDANPWRFYGGGIYHGDQNQGANHAINLVGWGVENGQEYWIVRNSWGEDFGENGYIRISTSADGGYDLHNTWAVDLPY